MLKLFRKSLFIILFVFICFFQGTKVSYALNTGECINMSSSFLEKIENGSVKLTYECFGAVGDGKVNDYQAILSAHKFANKEFIDKGIMLTVYGGGTDKTYYIGGDNLEPIYVITNVDWQKSNFIIDDYVLKNGKNSVDLSKNLFIITNPMRVGTGKFVLEYNVNDNNIVNSNVYKSLNGKVGKNVTNLLDFVNSLKNDTLLMNSRYKKYFDAAKVWGINVKNSNFQFIRTGLNNANSGSNQEDIILVNSSTGEVLNEINWDYDDITQIRVWPIPNTNIKISNGIFTTRTYNVVNGDKNYTQRNINVSFTGNVDINNIYHFLDEEAHPYTSSMQTNSYANAYYGFIRLYDAAFVSFKNLYLTPHHFTNNLGTYDLVFDNSSNLLFDNINYACDEYKSDGTKNYNSCYQKKMINPEVWGVIGSNCSKNVIIKNSRVNRVDAHRGITNLFVDNSVVGDKGFTLTGKRYLYLRKVKVDRANTMITLRKDYGSTWDGVVVLNEVTHVLDNHSGSNVYVFHSNNTMNHNYGYDTVFPYVYVNGITFDTSRVANNVNIHLLRLNPSVPSQGLYKYSFYGNVRFANLKLPYGKANIRMFEDSFVSNNNNLKLENYGKNNVVNVGYYNIDNFKLSGSDNNVNRLKNKGINTKFSFTFSNSTINTVNQNGIGTVERFFSNLEKKMKGSYFVS